MTDDNESDESVEVMLPVYAVVAVVAALQRKLSDFSESLAEGFDGARAEKAAALLRKARVDVYSSYRTALSEVIGTIGTELMPECHELSESLEDVIERSIFEHCSPQSEEIETPKGGFIH